MSNNQLAIIGGGSKFELIAQLGDIKRVSDRPTFRLTVRHSSLRGKQFEAEIGGLIDGVMAEDGSGESWILQGYIANTPNMPGWISAMFTENGYFSGRFHGYFDTRGRVGWLVPGSLKLS